MTKTTDAIRHAIDADVIPCVQVWADATDVHTLALAHEDGAVDGVAIAEIDAVPANIDLVPASAYMPA